MAITKVQILADIAATYKGVSAPEVLQAEVNGITWYGVNVFEIGKSTENEKQVGYRKNINFYVWHEGQADEDSFYGQDEPKNDVDKGLVSAASSYVTINKIYVNQVLRTRILGWIINKIMAVLAEDVGTAHHSMRLKWAQDALHDPEKYLNAYMCYISQSEEVQAAGNLSTDADFAWLSYMVNNVAMAFGFTD